MSYGVNLSQISLLDGTMLWSLNYHSDGEATIEYANKATERVNMNAIEWNHIRKGQRPFLLSRTPPVFPLKKIRQDVKKLYCLPSAHTVKGFADLSVFSSNISEH